MTVGQRKSDPPSSVDGVPASGTTCGQLASGLCESDRGEWGELCPACGRLLPPLPPPSAPGMPRAPPTSTYLRGRVARSRRSQTGTWMATRAGADGAHRRESGSGAPARPQLREPDRWGALTRHRSGADAPRGVRMLAAWRADRQATARSTCHDRKGAFSSPRVGGTLPPRRGCRCMKGESAHRQSARTVVLQRQAPSTRRMRVRSKRASKSVGVTLP